MAPVRMVNVAKMAAAAKLSGKPTASIAAPNAQAINAKTAPTTG